MDFVTPAQGSQYHYERGASYYTPYKKELVKVILNCLGFVLSLGIVFLGYSYGREQAIRQSVATKAAVPIPPQLQFSLNLSPTPTKVASTDTTTGLPICPEGFTPLAQRLFRLCIPQGFAQVETASIVLTVFASSIEELMVESGSSVLYPLHICTTERTFIKEGFRGTSYVFRQETGAGCGNVTGYAAVFTSGPSTSILPLHIRYRSLAANIIPSEDTYSQIISTVTFE